MWREGFTRQIKIHLYHTWDKHFSFYPYSCCIDSISILFSMCVEIVPNGFLIYCSWEFTCLNTDIPSINDALTFFCFGNPLFWNKYWLLEYVLKANFGMILVYPYKSNFALNTYLSFWLLTYCRYIQFRFDFVLNYLI